MLFVFLLVLNVLVLAAGRDYCSIPGCKGRHINCFKSGFYQFRQAPNIQTDKYLTFAEKLDILNRHNAFRNSVALGLETRGNPGPQPKAAAMMLMVWDHELEQFALTMGSVVPYAYKNCRHKLDGTRTGHYFMKFSHQNGRNGYNTVTISHIVKLQDRVSHLTPYGFRVGGNNERAKDYAKMAYDKARRLGCARTVTMVAFNVYAEILYCVYAPAMIEGQQIYVIGEPTSGCPAGRSARYTGLCVEGGYKDPLKEPKPNATLTTPCPAIKPPTVRPICPPKPPRPTCKKCQSPRPPTHCPRCPVCPKWPFCPPRTDCCKCKPAPSRNMTFVF